jgi:hypothetical protein
MMTPAEQQALAQQALLNYGAGTGVPDTLPTATIEVPQQTLPSLSVPDQTWASGVPDQRQLGEAALAAQRQAPAMSEEEQRQLAWAALAAQQPAPVAPAAAPMAAPAEPLAPAAAPLAAPPMDAAPGMMARPVTLADQGAPPPVTDEQLLNPGVAPAAAPAPAAVAAVPPAAAAGASTPALDEGLPPASAEAPAPELPPKDFQEALQRYNTSVNAETAAQTQQGETAALAEERKAALAAQQAAETRELARQHRAALDEQKANIDRLTGLARKATDEADAASNIEHKETTRSKVAGLLAMLGAGIADGFARMGGNNDTTYLKDTQTNIERAIALDLQQQRERFANKREVAKGRADDVAIAVKTFGDTPMADAFLRSLTANRYAAEIAEQTSKSSSENLRAGGQVLAAATRAQADKDMIDALNKQAYAIAMAKRANKAGSGSAAQYIANELMQMRREGKPLTRQQDAIARAREAELRAEHGQEFREDTQEGRQEAKAAAAHEKERQEPLPGFLRLPNQRELTPADVRGFNKIHESAVGVQESAEEAGRLWDLVMDPKTPDDVRARARADYERARNELLSAVSVASGQGTITKSDAERTSGSVPTLPANNAEWLRSSENWVKGVDPGAHTLRGTGNFVMDRATKVLRKTYGIVPAEEGYAKWAEWDKAHAPKGEATSKPQEKPAESSQTLPPPPEGQVAVLGMIDGKRRRFFASPEAAKAAIAKDPNVYSLE